MRALSHMRPPAGTESRMCEACGLCCLRRVSIVGERLKGDAGGNCTRRAWLLPCIGSISRATVYRHHQQNDVYGLKHDDEQ